MSERWAATSNPAYQVSTLGGVRSLPRFVACKGGRRVVEGRVLRKTVVSVTGYMQVDLSGKRESVHRLVAIAFCEGRAAGLVVNHKNGVRTDNRAENLEWITPSENIKDGYRRGRKNPFQGRTGADHPSSKAVISREILTGHEVRWPSALEATRSGFDSGAISKCCSGSSMTHKGRTWRFA